MAQTKTPLRVWNRYTGQVEEEYISEEASSYETKPQTSPTQWLQSQPFYENLYAMIQHTGWSARKIQPFVSKYQINLEEFEGQQYSSFEEFFVRRFRPGARTFIETPGQMPAFSEARYFAWEKFDAEQRFPVKGFSLDAAHILGSAERAQPFLGGPIILVRLSVMDYHHVHYFDSGRTLEEDRLGSRNWTVNWQALQNKEDIYFQNERQVNILETINFGRIGFVEIGALTVGKIVQVHPISEPFKRGEEKSFFHFGGSAIVMFGEPGAWRPSNDLLANTKEGIETFVRLGDTVAEAREEYKPA